MNLQKSVFVVFLFLLISYQSRATGIIIADEEKQTLLFNSKEDVVIRFADSIISHYDNVVIHLGRRYVFRKGNIYSSPKSQENLAMFSTYLQAHHVKVYYWFFDSFGGEHFDNLYKEYKEMIDENITRINELFPTYDGIFVDMEWINRKGYNNNKHFVEIIKYLRNKIDKKELYYFASLMDNDKSNKNRGFDINELKSYSAFPVEMLYINDGGFYMERKKVYPELDDSRLKQLTKYFKKKNWDVATSLTNTWVIKKGKEMISVTLSDEDIKEIDNNFTFQKQIDYKYFSIKYYKANKPLMVCFSGEQKCSLEKDQMIYFSEINKEAVKDCKYVWEYFNINGNVDLGSK